MKNIKIIFLVLVVMVIALPVLKFNIKSGSVSEIDNRELTEIPIDKSNTSISTWMSYVDDRIGFRSNAINAYTTIHDKIFNEMIHPTYEYGEDNYVFFKMSTDKTDVSYIDTYVNFIKKAQNYCEERNIPFIYVVEPKKDTIYNQYLPKGYHYDEEHLTYFFQALKENNINYVDNVSLLAEKAKSEQVFNKQYDAGHWNDLGAYYGVNNIIKAIQQYYPEVRLNEKRDFLIGEEIAETLPVSKFSIHEKIPTFTLKEQITQNFKNLDARYTGIAIDSQYQTFFANENAATNNDVKALFFQGSYLNGRASMLWNALNYSYNIHGYMNVIHMDYYVNIFQPDIVIFESAEYANNNVYYDEALMEEKNFNPPFNESDTKKLNITIETETKQSLTRVKVVAKKYTYAYLKMGDVFYDLQWDDKNQQYYVDLTEDQISNSYAVYVVK